MPDFEEVREFLSGNGFAVLEFDTETPSSVTAAVAVGCTVAEIAKSILLLVGGRPVLVVTSGDMKVNSSLLKKKTGLTGKVQLPDRDAVMSITGYRPGGVCPFLLPKYLPVYIDSSLKRFTRIFPAAGNQYSAVPMRYEQLKSLTSAIEADVCLPLET